jgi:AcrR family transcriptional regulator
VSGRKAEIIEVAKTVFAERGVRQATVREIGARAGILSGSLYHHFGSKLDIVDAILGDFCAEVLARYRSIAALDVDTVGRLRLMTDYAFSLIPQHSAPLVMILNDSRDLVAQPRFAYLVAFNDEVERHWVETLRAGVRDGELAADLDALLCYRFARDAIVGAIRWYREDAGRPLAEVAASFADLLLVGVAASPAPGPVPQL